MTRLLAVDPGPSSCGWALVERHGAKVRYLQSGTVAPALHAFDNLANVFEETYGEAVPDVAVEEPTGFVFQAFRGPTLLATAAVAGGIAWWGESLGMGVHRMSSEVVRATLIGKTRMRGKELRGDRDKLVKLALAGVVLGLPAKSNVHVRDALALAVVASWRLAGARPGLMARRP